MLPDDSQEFDSLEEIKETKGKLGTENVDDKLMRSVLDSDKDKIDNGKLIAESINQSLGSFTPDLMFENLVNNYQSAKKMYGEKIIRQVAGYDADYVERNRKIPEFQTELKKNISAKIKNLKKDKLLDKEGVITEEGFEISSVVTYLEEIDNLNTKGFLGEKINKKITHYGEKGSVKPYRPGTRYKDIDMRDTVKLAVRRGHGKIMQEDLKVKERVSKGSIETIYALDASASMKGKKIEMAKKAGIALSFKAIENKDKVGLIVFGDEIKTEVSPTHDFGLLLQRMNRIKATNQTNISKTLEKAYEMFDKSDCTKHLILLTDAMPTEGENPEKETIEACGLAVSAGITISVIGINLNKEGINLAKRIVEVGKGRLHSAKDIEDLDLIVLQDYLEERR